MKYTPKVPKIELIYRLFIENENTMFTLEDISKETGIKLKTAREIVSNIKSGRFISDREPLPLRWVECDDGKKRIGIKGADIIF